MKVDLIAIDPQNDFMEGGSLPVDGATADMQRLAAMVDRIGTKISEIHVTLDSHHKVDVGHPSMWLDVDGNQPPGLTPISAADIRSGIWTPIGANVKLPALRRADNSSRTVKEYMIEYADQLEAQGNYGLMVWPEHCLIGSPGHNVQSDLFDALNKWCGKKKANIDYVVKGVNPWTEHYGALHAEVPLPSDPSTELQLNGLLFTASKADKIAIAGEALSHCLRATFDQFVRKIDPALIRKFYLLTDCTSSIGAIPNGPDFPAISKEWLGYVQSLGMTLTTSTEFLA